MSAGRRVWNGKAEANKLLPEDRPAHNWYRFVLSFPPHLVRGYLRRFGVGQKHRVLAFRAQGVSRVKSSARFSVRPVEANLTQLANRVGVKTRIEEALT